MITISTSNSEIDVEEELEPPLYNALRTKFHLSEERINEIKEVDKVYPMKINDYYFSLIREVDDPIWRQCVPDIRELTDQTGEEDPLAEEHDSPLPLITHRYPDRVLFLISDTCEMHCRFCTRKRKIGTERFVITDDNIRHAIAYIRSHDEVRDVILSGGDALYVSYPRLFFILSSLVSIPHVEIIRLGTRIRCTNPSRITQELCDILKQFHPLYINVHFEHPNEITPEAIRACNLLADNGLVLGNQNVLLKDVNDDVKTMGDLYKGLLRMRVKPYYLFQADYVKGTNHFRTTIQKGKDIIYGLRGWISGLGIPQYVVDGCGGKVLILPDQYTQSVSDEKVVLMNYKGKIYEYYQNINV